MEPIEWILYNEPSLEFTVSERVDEESQKDREGR
jgi:hypothetical protein